MKREVTEQQIRNPYCLERNHPGTPGDTHLYCAYSPEQQFFHAAPWWEVFFGGAAGPGKTIALLCEGLRQVHIPAYRAIFFRRSYPELEQVEEYAEELFPHKGGRYNSSQHIWRFPSGAAYRLSYCERDKDKLRYQGKAYAYIALDELTQYPTDAVYTYLFTRCRPLLQGQGIRCYIRSASNPGGPGHAWVKERFIEGATPFVPRTFQTANGRRYDRCLVPATLDSNDILLHADGNAYETALLAHPDPEIRRALRFADWSIASGVLFSEVRKTVHQVPERVPQRATAKEIAMDWGYNHNAVALWVEQDPLLQARVYREYVINQMPPPVFAVNVVSRSTGENIRRAVLDPAAWATPQDGGVSPAEQMEPVFRAAGIALEPATKGAQSVKHGVSLLHTWFWPYRAGGPLLEIMDNCKKLWGELTTIVRGEPPEDIELPAKGQTDDCLAALRYWAQSRPEPPRPKASEIMAAMLGDVYARDPRTAVASQLERARRNRLPAVQDLEMKRRRREPWEVA
jgi:hypothetical protein